MRYYTDPIMICEYQLDGLTMDFEKQYRNPKGLGFALQTRLTTEEEKLQHYLFYFDKLKYKLSFNEIADNVGLTGEKRDRFKTMAGELLNKRKANLEEALNAIDIIEKINLMLESIHDEGAEKEQLFALKSKMIDVIEAINEKLTESVNMGDYKKAKDEVMDEIEKIDKILW